MATTKTQETMGLLNYSLTSRLHMSSDGRNMSAGYTKALENLVMIFANQAQKGAYTQEEIDDFSEQVGLVSVLEHQNYPGLHRVPVVLSTLTQDLGKKQTDYMVR